MRTFTVFTFLLCIFPLIHGQKLIKLWETDTIFEGPESVAYDPIREVLYVSNFRATKYRKSFYGNQFISKVNMKGEVIKFKWIEGLTEPTGICVFKDKLYIAERFGVVVYDLKKDKTEKKIWIQTAQFLNDISVGNDTTIFVSESNSNIIYKIKNDKVSIGFQSDSLGRTNGLLAINNKLIAGVNIDSSLKEINLETGEIITLAQMPKGIIDGIDSINSDYLVTIFEGSLFLVQQDGIRKELLNTRKEQTFLADFEYIESKNLLIIPTLWNNQLIAFSLKLTF